MLRGIKYNNSPAAQRIKDMIIPLLSSSYGNSRNDYIFYANFSLYINFIETTEISTGGVRIAKNGMEFAYNPEFVMSLPDEALRFFWLHELYHLLNRHNQRLMIHNHKKETANVAMDIVVNEMIIRHIDPKFANYNNSPLENGIFLSNIEKELGKKCNEKLVYEAIYKWLIENFPEGSEYNPKSGQWDDVGGEHPRQMDVHLEDEVSTVQADQIVKKVVSDLRQRGQISSELSQRLKDFTKPKKDYMRLFSTIVSGLSGDNKEKSHNRPNRRINEDGLKGNKSSGAQLAVILDTSGSMSDDFSKAISQIFRQGYQIEFIQCDTKVKDHTRIKTLSQFKNISIKGLGGTTLQPAIDYIKDTDSLKGLSLIILTDGYTDSLDLSGIKKTLILTVGEECPIDKGNVKQIVIEK